MMDQSYYDQEYFDLATGKGYPGKYTRTCAPWGGLAQVLVDFCSPTDAADYGCARGFMVAELRARAVRLGLLGRVAV